MVDIQDKRKVEEAVWSIRTRPTTSRNLLGAEIAVTDVSWSLGTLRQRGLKECSREFVCKIESSSTMPLSHSGRPEAASSRGGDIVLDAANTHPFNTAASVLMLVQCSLCYWLAVQFFLQSAVTGSPSIQILSNSTITFVHLSA